MKVSDWIAESPMPRYTDALRIDASVLVLGDLEIPHHEALFVNKCISLAKAWGIRDLVLAGDAVHWASLSPFLESPKNTDEEIETIGEYLPSIVRPFDRVWWIAGNHDRRPQWMLDRSIAAAKITRLLIPSKFAEEFASKVQVSDYFYAWVSSQPAKTPGQGAWLIEHPKATSVVPVAAARKIAEAQGCCVAMFHNHLLGISPTPDGKRLAVEGGCACDPERLEYYQLRHTTRPKMVIGALILRKVGDVFYPTLLSQWTDFNWETRGLGEKAKTRRSHH